MVDTGLEQIDMCEDVRHKLLRNFFVGKTFELSHSTQSGKSGVVINYYIINDIIMESGYIFLCELNTKRPFKGTKLFPSDISPYEKIRKMCNTYFEVTKTVNFKFRINAISKYYY